MISVYDTASREATLAQPLDPQLRTHIERHIELSRRNGLPADATHSLVIQPSDMEWEIEDEIGFSPVMDNYGHRFGHPDFVTYWDRLTDLGGWYELIDTIDDSDLSFILLIEDAKGVLPDLLAMCQDVCL